MRRRFRFRLARVRRVRELEERVARATWGAAQSAASAAARAREGASAELLAARKHHVDRLAAGASSPASLLVEHRILDSQVHGLSAVSEVAKTRAAQAAALADAWRTREVARRALQELEKRARERHLIDLRAHEGAEMDEIAGMRDAGDRRREGRERRETDSSSTAALADQRHRSHLR